jgi:hypothetical protein
MDVDPEPEADIAHLSCISHGTDKPPEAPQMCFDGAEWDEVDGSRLDGESDSDSDSSSSMSDSSSDDDGDPGPEDRENNDCGDYGYASL